MACFLGQSKEPLFQQSSFSMLLLLLCNCGIDLLLQVPIAHLHPTIDQKWPNCMPITDNEKGPFIKRHACFPILICNSESNWEYYHGKMVFTKALKEKQNQQENFPMERSCLQPTQLFFKHRSRPPSTRGEASMPAMIQQTALLQQSLLLCQYTQQHKITPPPPSLYSVLYIIGLASASCWLLQCGKLVCRK